MNNLLLPTLVLVSVLGALPAGCKPGSAAPRGSATVAMRIGGETFNLEVADSDDEQRRGLMYRDAMPPDHGMIFVFAEEEERSFWMKNTLLPLDILYLDARGRVVSIKPMKPRDLTGVPSDEAAMYAVELNHGAAARAGVRVGDTLTIPADVGPAEADGEGAPDDEPTGRPAGGS